MRGGVAIPARRLVITFDDGAQDGFTHAWPLLRRSGFVGTFYLITSRTRDHNHPWSYSMSQEQARELAEHGNEIADHTRHHVCLAGTSAAASVSEIEGGA